jgi:soluble lytic murein transglycosylase-like protein
MAALRARRLGACLLRYFGIGVSAALLVLLATPGKLIGESYQASAAKQRRMEKIHSWLLSQDGSSTGMAAVLAHRILQESEKNSLDPVLILALIQVESGFDHNAVSPRGAQGLMQVMPVVITELVEEGIIPASAKKNLKDPLVNVQIGVSYLAHLNEMFGDLQVALTAYNWGPTRIKQKLAAKESIPGEYAANIIRVHRSLMYQLARNSFEARNDSAHESAG